MKTQLKILLSFVLIMVIGAFVVFLSKSYYPSLPIEGISKREAVSLLNKSNQDLVMLYEAESYNWYGFKGNQLNGSKALVKEAEQRNWLFQEQLGSGYIFQDSSNSIKIAESQMWTGKYVLYKVEND